MKEWATLIYLIDWKFASVNKREETLDKKEGYQKNAW